MNKVSRKPLFATIQSDYRWTIYFDTPVNGIYSEEGWGNLDDLYKELKRYAVMVPFFDVYNVTPIPITPYNGDQVIKISDGVVTQESFYAIDNIKEVNNKPYNPISYSEYKKLFHEQHPERVVEYGENITYGNIPRNLNQRDFIYEIGDIDEVYLITDIFPGNNPNEITEAIRIDRETDWENLKKVKLSNDYEIRNKDHDRKWLRVPLFDHEKTEITDFHERKKLHEKLELFVDEAFEYKTTRDKLVSEVKETDEYKKLDKKYPWVSWSESANKKRDKAIEPLFSHIAEISLFYETRNLIDMLFYGTKEVVNKNLPRIEKALQELKKINTNKGLKKNQFNMPTNKITTPNGEVIPAPNNEIMRMSTWSAEKEDPEHFVYTEQVYFTYDDLLQTFGDNVYINAGVTNYGGGEKKSAKTFRFVNVEYSLKQHDDDFQLLPWYKEFLTDPKFDEGKSVMYNGKMVKVFEVLFGARNPNTKEVYRNTWVYTLYPDGRKSDPYKGMIMIPEKELVAMQKDQPKQEPPTSEKSQENKLVPGAKFYILMPDMKSLNEVGTITKVTPSTIYWEFGSKPYKADTPTAEFVGNIIDGVYTWDNPEKEPIAKKDKKPKSNKGLSTDEQALISEFESLYEKTNEFNKTLEGKAWSEFAQVRAYGSVVAETLTKGVNPNGSKLTEADKKKDLETIQNAVDYLQNLLGSSKPKAKKEKSSEKELSLEDLKTSLKGAKLSVKYLTGKEKTDVETWIKGLEVAIKYYN